MRINRRDVLRATTATAASAALFSGVAAANWDSAFIDVECVGDDVVVTLRKVELLLRRRPQVEPTDLENLEVFFGREDVIDLSGDDYPDRDEVIACYEGTDPDCSPIAFPTSTVVVGDDIVYTFDRAEAGLSDVTEPTPVVLAGVYDDPSRDQRPVIVSNPDGREYDRVYFDPATCPCVECGDDGEAEGVSELTLRNDSGAAANVTVYNDKEAKDDAVLFTGFVGAGETVTVSAPAGEDTLKNDISVYIGDTKNAEIHTSCSKPLGSGLKRGDFTVVSGLDTDGDALCNVDCATCGGDGDADGVSELTVEFQGADGSFVQFYNDKEAKGDALLFEGILDGGEEFTVSAPAGEDTLKSDVSIYDDGERAAVFHTSCSRLIGPGTSEGGFEVVAGRDKTGRPLCDLDLADCRGCGTGDDDAEKIGELTFRFTGSDGSRVQFYNGKDGKPENLLFDEPLDGDESFTVSAPPEKDEFEGDVSVWVDGTKNAQFHASCSQPLGPGIAKGDVVITAGEDRAGRPLCDVGCATCGDGGEAEGVSQLTFKNVSGGPLENATVYNDKEAKDDAVLFGPTTVDDGKRLTVSAPAGEDTLENDVSIYVDSNGDGEAEDRVAVFHTSCSRLIGPGTSEGGFEVVAGRDKAGRSLCALDLDDCRGCGTGDDDADKAAALTLRNDSGGDLTDVAVYNGTDAKSENLLFGPQDVSQAATFTVSAPPEKDEFESDISVWVDGTKAVEIHTSCSQPLGPGIKKGDFTITAGEDRAGRPLCDVGCATCGGDGDADGVSQLTVQFGGDDGSLVQFYNDTEAKSDALLFEGTLDGGEEFTVTPPAGEDELKSDVSIYDDGKRAAVFHTSCSQLLGPGISEGGFEIVAGRDTAGRALCALDLDDCRGCGTGDDDAEKVGELTFEFRGADGSRVQFYNGTDGKSENLLFDETLDSEDSFTVSAPPAKDEFAGDVSVWVDGTKNAQFHASCSQPLGPGIAKGDVRITGGKDKVGHPLCDVGCAACGEGDDDADGITQLTLENSSGGALTDVVVYNDKEAKDDAVLFGPEDVADGGTVTISAPAGADELKTDISVYVDGSKDTTIHTSCSKPLGVGDVFGSFTVTGGRDKAGRSLCDT